MTKPPSYVKSVFAETPVAKTRLDIMTMLERYGGTGFGYEVLGDTIVIRFTVPGTLGVPLRIEYPVNIGRVQERIAAYLKAKERGEKSTRERAERVAWRNIYEMVDAAFAAAAIGASTPEEAFHAHLVVRTEDGVEGRLFDYIETLRHSSGGALPGTTGQKRLPGK